MELRVLSGPQAGCRLPLGTGTYRAGADETCDVVLEGLAGRETAFVVYVGQRSLGLESLSDELRLGGRAVSGLVSLVAGQVFELGPWLFAIDDSEAPWPSDPESLRASAHGANASADAELQDHDEAMLAPVDAAMDTAAASAATAAGLQEAGPSQDESGGPHGDSSLQREDSQRRASEKSGVSTTDSAPQRRKVPFWVIGLAGTAAFMACGVMVLVMSLAPAPPAAAATHQHQPADELAKLAAASNGDVKLEHLPDGRSKLEGSVATRDAKLKLTRRARVIEPNVLLQLTADEDIETLARDAMSAFPQSGVEVGNVDHGRLALTGHVSEAKLRDQIVATIWDSVPGLAAVDSHVIAGDEVLASFNTLLNDAGLAKKIAGQLGQGDANRLTVRGVLSDADRTTWADVRQKLETRFGVALAVVEDLHAPDAVPPSMAPVESNIVAVVRGPMPYALLRDGTKRALPAGAK
jgi:type III secretion system YscD/HrpQ family protein